MEQRNQVELSVLENETHLSLNILDIICFTGRLKLDYLGDDVATEIVTAYNEHVEETLHIQIGMSGNEIRELFQKLPNDTKNQMKAKTIIHGFTSKTFLNNLIKFSGEERDFYLRDDKIKGSLINMFSIIVIITCLLMFYVYSSTSGYREVLSDTIASRLLQSVIDYITFKFQ